MSQVALVTGSASGLGLSIAKGLLEDGFRVVISDVDIETANAAVESLKEYSDSVVSFKLNVLYKNDFEEALAFCIETFGQVDVLVNNAAMTPTTPVMDITAEEFDQVVSINQRGTFFGCQVFGAHFADQNYGRIINMASLAGQNGGAAAGAHYASSKGAILTLTKVFAGKLAANKVTVNAVAPGPIDLPSVRALVPPEKLAQIIDNVIPVKELGDAAVIADMVVLLASQKASGITGAAWDANGGIYMR